jgi:hypothetical protein
MAVGDSADAFSLYVGWTIFVTFINVQAVFFRSIYLKIIFL